MDGDQPWWWEWELVLGLHVLRRMVDRKFNGTDPRAMLAVPVLLRPGVEPGRWIVETRHDGRSWEVVLEPDGPTRTLVVVTAYAAD